MIIFTDTIYDWRQVRWMIIGIRRGVLQVNLFGFIYIVISNGYIDLENTTVRNKKKRWRKEYMHACEIRIE